jgi:hypothetical protein
MCRCVPFWKISSIFKRGNVALSPVLFSSSIVVIQVSLLPPGKYAQTGAVGTMTDHIVSVKHHV